MSEKAVEKEFVVVELGFTDREHKVHMCSTAKDVEQLLNNTPSLKADKCILFKAQRVKIEEITETVQKVVRYKVPEEPK